jgi:hypothetical protein
MRTPADCQSAIQPAVLAHHRGRQVTNLRYNRALPRQKCAQKIL